MLALIDDPSKIEEHEPNTFEGTGYEKYLAAEVDMSGEVSTPQLQLKSLKNSSILLKKVKDLRLLVELSKDRFMVDRLIINNWQVVAEVQQPDGLSKID